MTSNITLSFRYLERDYVRALRAHYASVLRLRLDLCVMVAVTGLGLYLWRSPGQHWLGVLCVSLASLLALMLVAAFFIIPSWVFRREPKFCDDYSLTFSPAGIRFRTAHIDSNLEWSMYRKALCDRHSYLLYYGVTQFSLVPKRVFESPEQRRAFDAMIDERIPQIVRVGGREAA